MYAWYEKEASKRLGIHWVPLQELFLHYQDRHETIIQKNNIMMIDSIDCFIDQFSRLDLLKYLGPRAFLKFCKDPTDHEILECLRHVPECIHQIKLGMTENLLNLLLQEKDRLPLIYLNESMDNGTTSFSQKLWRLVIRKNPESIEKCTDVQDVHVFEAIKGYGESIKFLKERTDVNIDRCLEMSKGYCFQFLKEEEKTLERTVKAVQLDGLMLEYASLKNEEICQIAIQQNGNAIRFCQQTKDLKNLAIQSFPWSIRFFHILEYKDCINAVSKHGTCLWHVPKMFQTNRLNKIAISKSPQAILACKYQTSKLWKIALSKHGLLLEYLPDCFYTKDLEDLAILQNPKAAKYRRTRE